jgi:AraC family ethanolamine operon transcriptional activator
MSAPASEVRPGLVQSSRFDDMDAMASAMIGDHIEFLPLRPGHFHGRFCRIDLDGIHLKRIVHTPFLIHGAITADDVALNLHVRPAGGLTLNGDAFDAPMLAVLSEGTAVQAICPAEQDRFGLVFRAEAFARLIDSYGIPAFPRGVHRMLHLRVDQADRLVRAFAAMTDLADNLPNLFVVPGLDKALTEECHRLLAGVLSGEESRPERPPRTKDMLRQVSAADEFLHANIDRPVYTEELCAALRVSARTLHYSFAAVYGMSPHTYLKRRRLVLVRRALRSAGENQAEDQAMVKSVVLAHGFWHLGRVAHEYAAMFGEMPSETLGGGRGRADPALA